MTKAARKHKSSRRRMERKKQWVVPAIARLRSKRALSIAVVVLLAGIPFSMGKYFEFNSPGPFDSGAYVYSARHILEGAEIGVEEKPSAQLGTLLVNMLGVWLCGYNETGPKLMQTALQAAALFLMFIALKELFGTLPAAVGVVIASVYLSAPLIAKFGNVKEQYMIACMVIGISCFVLHQLSGKWPLAVLAGAFLSWAPLFKQTGLTAIGALGLFLILQPALKNRTFRQTGRDILLLLGGAAVGVGPLYVWILAWDVQLDVPYAFVWQTLAKMLPKGADAQPVADYVAGSRKLVPFSQQWPMVLRYYGLLILPISVAVGAIIARIVRAIRPTTRAALAKPYDRFVLLLALWWLLDMAFVWISPRSYEQYYLPLTASAAMLGGYLIAVYWDKLEAARRKDRWIVIGLAGLLAMIVMSWHVFFGMTRSPYTGMSYGSRTKGYAQTFRQISRRRKDNLKAPWQVVGGYIRDHSGRADKIYVWGWFPGIYVEAQRFSSASKAVCMPRPAPQILAETVAGLIAEFQREMPRFIVDSRKRHIPTIRPPYELWPILPKGFAGIQKPWFLPQDEKVIEAYDKGWSDMLGKRFDEDEAERYRVLGPFRKFVMDNYKLVEPRQYVATNDGQLLHRMFGDHVLFELKNPQVRKEPQ